MMISTKGRYALRVLIDLGEHRNGEYIPMKDVANRQEISLKYLEKIMPVLIKNNVVEAIHGKGGGYRLTRSPDEYKVGDILRMTEGELVPVACLSPDAPPCSRAAECKTLPMWQKFSTITAEYFDGITIADLMRNNAADNYVI